jgi:hypothetical protein
MRTNVADVRLIISTSVTDPVIDAYILGSNLLVTQVLGASDLGEDLLQEIERWLTAHNISMTQERLAKKEGAGGAFIEYMGTSGQGLSATSYGQMVLIFDTTGEFALLQKIKQKAGISAVPKQLPN